MNTRNTRIVDLNALSTPSSGSNVLLIIDTSDTTLSPQGTDKKISITNLSSYLASVPQTLTNKTLDTAGTGNVFKINGTQVSDITGTGKVALQNSPTLITPALGAATATSINGVTIPSASDTAALLAATQTVTNKTVGDTLNMTTGNITQSGAAAHLTLTPGTSKLVRTAVLRQDITSNAYVNNSVMLTGWNYITILSGSTGTQAVTFGLTFLTAPIVVTGLVGIKLTTAPTVIGDLTTSFVTNGLLQGWGADSITTTGFNVSIKLSGNVGANTYIGFAWSAIATF